MHCSPRRRPRLTRHPGAKALHGNAFTACTVGHASSVPGPAHRSPDDFFAFCAHVICSWETRGEGVRLRGACWRWRFSRRMNRREAHFLAHPSLLWAHPCHRRGLVLTVSVTKGSWGFSSRVAGSSGSGKTQHVRGMNFPKRACSEAWYKRKQKEARRRHVRRRAIVCWYEKSSIRF